MKVSGLGLAWYRREDYAKLLLIFEDADKLPATYDEWLIGAEKGLERFKSQGIFTIKVIIDPDQFPGWCAVNGHNVDAKARIRFASIEAARQARQSN
jgi:hypothetical protein